MLLRTFHISVSLPILLISKLASSIPLTDADNELDSGLVDLSYLGTRVFAQPDPETGKKVENWDPDSGGNPEELGEYAEGDIVFPKKGRNGIAAESFRWKDGVVPYEVRGNFAPKDLEVISKAMGVYKKYTCITFRGRTANDKDYISIVNDRTGCWSSVGRTKGKQIVSLQSPGCTTLVGTAIHELMHAVGFVHEQSRYERDDYVTIDWRNIQTAHQSNFNKAQKNDINAFGVPYDYSSVMHYSKTAFAQDKNKPTIIPKNPEKASKMGQREGFSKGDITKINAMYNCPEKTLEVVKGNISAEATDNSIDIDQKEPSNPLIDAASALFSWIFKK